MTGKKTKRARDFLDEMIDERTARNPDFPKRVDAAISRRELLRALAKVRSSEGLSQAEVATRMQTSQPAIAKIEAGEIDVRTSTLQRYAAAVGGRIEYRFVPGRGRSRVRAAG